MISEFYLFSYNLGFYILHSYFILFSMHCSKTETCFADNYDFDALCSDHTNKLTNRLLMVRYRKETDSMLLAC